MRATGLRGGKPADPSVSSPPLRRSPCSSICNAVSLYGCKNRGEAPRRWLFSEPRLVSFRPRLEAAHGQAGPPPKASLRETGPTFEISCQVHMVPGVVYGKTEALPAPQRTMRFLEDNTSQSSPPHPPWTQSAQERPRDLGRDQRAGHGSTPGGAGPMGGTHAHGQVLLGEFRPEPHLGG